MPGLDRTGPQGEGPLTGGRRGLCVPQEHRGRGLGRGAGRGGRPYGGGHGRAWGGGYGARGSFGARWAPPDDPTWEEPAPVGVVEMLGMIRDRLSELAQLVGELYGRFEAGRKSTGEPEEQEEAAQGPHSG